MNSKKTYKATGIPKRPFDQIDIIKKLREKVDYDPFTEIEIAPINNETTHEDCQIRYSIKDQNRVLFYKMRSIARSDASIFKDEAKLFYKQAIFMQDFSDDYEDKKEFFSYFPYYQIMGYEQLRTYFTWRSQVRKGNISETSTSYAFLYIYEILNNIGVESPQAGLDTLMNFWHVYRRFNPIIDRYLIQWVKDYHIYYPLEQTFCQFVDQNNLRAYYPTIFGYEIDSEESFTIFTAIANYKIQKSIFFNQQNQPMIEECFCFILGKLRERFREKKKNFDDLIFYQNETIWRPFASALFYPHLEQLSREVVLSSKEKYLVEHNQWRQTHLIFLDSGKQLLTYIIKKMEIELRRIVKFKHKLSVRVEICGNKNIKLFERLGYPLADTIVALVNEFYRLHTVKPVILNFANLQQIKAESLQIQQRLVVPDINETIVELPVIENVTIKAGGSDMWTQFWEELTKLENEAVKAILLGDDLKQFAIQNNIMLEILIDGINQKALELICDVIIGIEDRVVIYEEYREKLKKGMK